MYDEIRYRIMTAAQQFAHAHCNGIPHVHVRAYVRNIKYTAGHKMASSNRTAGSCAEAVAKDESYDHRQHSAADDQPRSLGKDFDFVERPSEDFFCPVSLELLLEPQLTSCCGHHLSLEAATRLQREGKPCPMCNGEEWSGMLDKYHRRRVHEVRVRCWHKENGCEWVGEVNELKRHTVSCVKRLWECQYCALKCTYGEGEGNHWPTCTKFPEPCPNGCEVGSVERCNMEQHRSVCSLEPVACEMKEFGCSVVVPCKELATHMRESELQHLTAMTMLNLRLCRQLQQDSTERDRKMAQLQQEMAEQKKQGAEIKCQMVQLVQQQREMMQLSTTQAKQIGEQKWDMSNLVGALQSLLPPREPQPLAAPLVASPNASPAAQCVAAGGVMWSVTEYFTVTQYAIRKDDRNSVFCDPFYTHNQGYKFMLLVDFYVDDIGASLYLMKGEYDRRLPWPVKVDVRLELLNQAGDHSHVARINTIMWLKSEKERDCEISDTIIKYSTLEKQSGNVRHMMYDCLRFKITVTVV